MSLCNFRVSPNPYALALRGSSPCKPINPGQPLCSVGAEQVAWPSFSLFTAPWRPSGLFLLMLRLTPWRGENGGASARLIRFATPLELSVAGSAQVRGQTFYFLERILSRLLSRHAVEDRSAPTACITAACSPTWLEHSVLWPKEPKKGKKKTPSFRQDSSVI